MDVAEELLDVGHTVDRAYVERRLDDWRLRVDGLYARMSAWLPPGWSMTSGREVPILEDLMLRFDLPQRTLPSKILTRRGSGEGHGAGPATGRVEPRGLWIVGANGRVDLITPERHSILVDRAQSFEHPEWVIMPLRDRLDRRQLSIDTFRACLE